MTRKHARFSAPFLLGLLCSAAQAEPSLSLSLGAFQPANSDTRHRAGTTLLIGALRSTLPASSSQTRTVLEGTAAYGKQGDEASVLVSGTVGQVFSLSPGRSPLSSQAVYLGVGAGVYGMDLSHTHAFGRVGIYGEAGYNFSRTLFVCAQYRLVDRGNGASLLLGTRF